MLTSSLGITYFRYRIKHHCTRLSMLNNLLLTWIKMWPPYSTARTCYTCMCGLYSHISKRSIDQWISSYSYYYKFYSTKRTGVIAIKLGLIPQWTKEGKKALCTVLQVGNWVIYCILHYFQICCTTKLFVSNEKLTRLDLFTHPLLSQIQ